MVLQADKTRVLLLAGLPGVGKTTLAGKLAPKIGAVVLNRDDIRDSIFPAAFLDYSSAQNEVATETLLNVLTYLLGHRPPPVILLDGKPFSRRAEIEAVARRVDQHGAQLIVIHCIAPPSLVEERLRRGLEDPRNVRAERHPAKAARIRGEFEPITHPHITVDMSALIDDAVDQCIRLLSIITEGLIRGPGGRAQAAAVGPNGE